MNGFSQNDEEAARRFEYYKSEDPFPDIPPALLNSADVWDYVRVTGMISPFDQSPGKIKSASYEIDLLGEIHLWDEKQKKKVIPIERGKKFILEKNSIVYAYLETKFRLPDYIALRFNLRIKHVHRGLLLGTGPLVDPGFVGRLLIPLHNLTSEDYELEGGEGLIWVEFTKLSPNKRWVLGNTIHTLYGEYRGFPDDKKNLEPAYYFDRATQGNVIRSSIPEIFLDVTRRAKTSERSARSAKRTVNLFIGIFSFLGLISLGFTAFSLIPSILSLTQDATAYVRGSSKEIEDFQNRIVQQNLEAQEEMRKNIKALEKEIYELKNKIDDLSSIQLGIP